MSSRSSNVNEHVMSFGDHLEELRRCLLYAVVGIVPLFVLALVYSRELILLVTYPVRAALKKSHLPESLQSTGVFETFNASIQIAIVITIVLGSPWILWQVWRFIAPGLHDYEKRFVHVLLPLSAGLTVTSVLFFYSIVLPIVLTFMINWGVMKDLTQEKRAPLPPGVTLPVFPMLDADPDAPPVGSAWINREQQRLHIALPDGVYGVDIGPQATIAPDYRVREYLSMLITMALSFALAFQTPVVVLMLGWVGLIDTRFLSKYRRHAVLVSLVAGALLTPGDPIVFVMVTVPIYLLYELGGLLLWLLPASRVGKRRDADDDAAEDPPGRDAATRVPPPLPPGDNGAPVLPGAGYRGPQAPSDDPTSRPDAQAGSTEER
ncbi:MAG: twin-arginine translocase subunit TatC [Phycisphaerales bacterium]|nr:twin-arginine translocase subunit TatC [Phycisphaerales bacterium]